MVAALSSVGRCNTSQGRWTDELSCHGSGRLREGARDGRFGLLLWRSQSVGSKKGRQQWIDGTAQCVV